MTKRVMTNMRFETVLLLVLFGCQPMFYSSSSPEQSGVNILCTLPLCLGCWIVHGLLQEVKSLSMLNQAKEEHAFLIAKRGKDNIAK